MYEAFFGLAERPFSLTPNPRYMFYADQYREASDRMLFGVDQREGFMVLTGVPGSGKTTLCRDLFNKLNRDEYRTALIFNPFLNGREMLEALLTEFEISYPSGANRKELLEKLNNFLLAQLVAGRTCVAIFDEAQHLAPEFLEQIRVLSNLETDEEKLINIILVGQPELLHRIRAPEMAQLDQRVSVRCTLGPLGPEETDRYIHHRLNVAGAQGRIQFSSGAMKKIHEESKGLPRVINLLADRSLLAAFAEDARRIGTKHVGKAVQLLRGEPIPGERPKAAGSTGAWVKVAAFSVVLLIVAAAVVGLLNGPLGAGR